MSITSERVKEVLGELRQASLEQICAGLGLPEADYKARDAVRKVLRELERREFVLTTRAHNETAYSLTGKDGRGAKQIKLWRAMGLKFRKAEPWSIRVVAGLAGCVVDYAKRYAYFLWDKGFIEKTGENNRVSFFRVVPGKENEPAPHWNRREEKRQAVQQIPPDPPFPKGGEAPAGGTPAPPEEGKTIYQMGLEAAAGRCDLTGGKCASFPEGCEMCSVWTVLCLSAASVEIPPNPPFSKGGEMPILNCDCPGADCTACAEKEDNRPEAGATEKTILQPGSCNDCCVWEQIAGEIHGERQFVREIMAGMRKFVAGLRSTLGTGAAYIKAAREILLQMEQELGKISRKAPQKEGAGHDPGKPESHREC